MTRDSNEALKQPAITSDIEKASFKQVFQRLDAFVEGLLPLLRRGDIALTAARKKALRFVLDETKSGPIDNIYRWDDGNFDQHLSEPQSNWRPRLLIQIAPWSRLPAFVPKLVSEPESAALIKVAEILLDLVRGQTSPQEQRDARDNLLREAQNYLWHRGRVARQGYHQFDRPMMKLLDYARTLKGKQRRVLEIVIEEGRVAKLCDVASDKVVDWMSPYSEYNALEYHLNTKLSKLRPRWHLKRHDKEIRLEPGAVQRSQEKTERKSK